MKKDPRRLRFIEPFVRRAFCAVLDAHPEIADRLGNYAASRIRIDIRGAPFCMVLQPSKRAAWLYRRGAKVKSEATVSGGFMTLLKLASGDGDGDALFFSRDIGISGDTEAVVALRNALDDSGLDIIHEIFSAFGFPGLPLRLGYKAFRSMRPLVAGMFGS
ncbi:MAG: SCP2 sterol-binding domain-containing protein [Alphaproteobacteria bacterium]|nr:SCP2 sterol-binding domain-containing protein [Alphaproteobacteria bacterium]MDE2336191.1 SCP2 sterol-binding domain-containing protein [Alphaproteobacteria bacterium]